MNLINKNDIKKFASYNDREDCFDDKKELLIISNFLESKCDPLDCIKEKPFGKYCVDIGVFDSDKNIKFTVDVERWSFWREDWPSNYRYISFLERKEKFLKNNQFVMVLFNYDLTKFVRIRKEDILKFSPEKRFTKGKYDNVRKIPFKYGKLYGTGFTEREKSIFEHEIYEI